MICPGSEQEGWPVGFKLFGKWVRTPELVICTACGATVRPTRGGMVRDHGVIPGKAYRLEGKERPDD